MNSGIFGLSSGNSSVDTLVTLCTKGTNNSIRINRYYFYFVFEKPSVVKQLLASFIFLKYVGRKNYIYYSDVYKAVAELSKQNKLLNYSHFTMTK